MYYVSLLLPFGLLASFIARHLALQKGLNERRWRLACLLAALHSQGRLSDRKYAAQTQRLRARPLRRPWDGWWWQAPIVLVAMWVVWPKRTVGFPTCDAGGARELVRQAIENADDSGQVTRRLLALDQVRELSFDADRRDRYCSGTAVLNAGERQIVWRMYARGDSIVANVSGF